MSMIDDLMNKHIRFKNILPGDPDYKYDYGAASDVVVVADQCMRELIARLVAVALDTWPDEKGPTSSQIAGAIMFGVQSYFSKPSRVQALHYLIREKRGEHG